MKKILSLFVVLTLVSSLFAQAAPSKKDAPAKDAPAKDAPKKDAPAKDAPKKDAKK